MKLKRVSKIQKDITHVLNSILYINCGWLPLSRKNSLFASLQQGYRPGKQCGVIRDKGTY